MSDDVYTSTDSLVTADVDVFTPDLDCEPATVVDKQLLCSNRHCIPVRLNLTISTASCLAIFWPISTVTTRELLATTAVFSI